MPHDRVRLGAVLIALVALVALVAAIVFVPARRSRAQACASSRPRPSTPPCTR